MRRCTAKWNEKDLELYTCRNMAQIADLSWEFHPPNFSWQLLGTQIPTSAGIIDALLLSGGLLFIIEFKSVKATDRTVGQLQRYRTALALISFDDKLEVQGVSGFVHQSVQSDLPASISSMIIAPDFSQEALLGCDVCIQTHKKYGMFHFERVSASIDHHYKKNQHLAKTLSPWVQDAIDNATAREAALK